MENNYEGEMKNEEEDNEEVLNDEIAQNNKDFISQEGMENEQIGEGDEDDDDRLTYTLITLDLGNLIHIFEDNNISFVDMLLLSKEDLIELQLEIFQRNRILNFSKLFAKYAKNYSIREISDFFTFNKQFIFNSSIYDKVFANNINSYQNEINNENLNNDNNNYNPISQEMNYTNTNPNLNENMSTNFIGQTIKSNNINTKINNQTFSPKIKQIQSKGQNINGGTKKNKIINISKNSNINDNNDINENNNNDKFSDLIKKRKTTKSQSNINRNNFSKNMKNQNEFNRNEEYQKIIEKIGMIENYEMSYELYTKLNLIKNYINNKGDKISLEDIKSINNDIDQMIESMNYNLNYKNEITLNNNESNKKKNRIKVIKKNK